MMALLRSAETIPCAPSIFTLGGARRAISGSIVGNELHALSNSRPDKAVARSKECILLFIFYSIREASFEYAPCSLLLTVRPRLQCMTRTTLVANCLQCS